jgi:hypothetical protein
MVQPLHAWRKESIHASPLGAAAFVIAGLTSLALPANGCMYCFHAAAATWGDMCACPALSGSLKLEGRRGISVEPRRETSGTPEEVLCASLDGSVGSVVPAAEVVGVRPLHTGQRHGIPTQVITKKAHPEHRNILDAAREVPILDVVPVVRPSDPGPTSGLSQEGDGRALTSQPWERPARRC